MIPICTALIRNTSNHLPSVCLIKMASVTTTSPELVHGRHGHGHPFMSGDFRMPHAPAPAPIVSSSTCSPPGSVVMRPPPPPPPKIIHRLPDIKHERIHHEEPSSSIPDLGKSYNYVKIRVR